MERLWPQVLHELEGVLRERGIQAWLVGGSVRDALLGRPLRDMDVAIASDGHALDDLVAALPDALRRGVGRLRHDTVRVALDDEHDLHLDLSQMHGSTIAQDLATRDFTINAMALPLAAWRTLLTGEHEALVADLIDPLGGLADLRARQLRLPSTDAFEYDPGRILRAARFIAGLGMASSAETDALAKAVAPEIEQLHPGRVHEELNALFALPELAIGVRWLRKIGALEHLAVLPPTRERPVTPEHEFDVLERALALAAQLHPAARDMSGVLAPLAALLAQQEWYAQPLWSGYPRFVALPWSEFALALLGRPQTPLAASGRPAARWFPWVMPVPGGVIERCAWASVRSLEAATRLLTQASPSLPDLRHFFAMEPAMEDYAVDALVVAVVHAVAEAESTGGVSGAQEMVARSTTILGEFFADEKRFVPDRLLTGRELNQLLPPHQYPQIRRVLRAVREAQLDGHITTREEAVALARELAKRDEEDDGTKGNQ
ncbi:MAG TPA: hypothetical protein VF120_11525 [Ktedonobacterales bacterium]